MSQLTDILEQREMQICAQSTAETTTLETMPLGSSANVVGFIPGVPERTARRLFDLGFLPGVPVVKSHRTPLGGPIVYRLPDYEIALRPAEANKIVVEVA